MPSFMLAYQNARFFLNLLSYLPSFEVHSSRWPSSEILRSVFVTYFDFLFKYAKTLSCLAFLRLVCHLGLFIRTVNLTEN